MVTNKGNIGAGEVADDVGGRTTRAAGHRDEPAANSGLMACRLSECAMAQPRKGMMRNCAPHPVAMGRGAFNTRLKSSNVSVTPIPNMMTGPSPA